MELDVVFGVFQVSKVDLCMFGSVDFIKAIADIVLKSNVFFEQCGEIAHKSRMFQVEQPCAGQFVLKYQKKEFYRSRLACIFNCQLYLVSERGNFAAKFLIFDLE